MHCVINNHNLVTLSTSIKMTATAPLPAYRDIEDPIHSPGLQPTPDIITNCSTSLCNGSSILGISAWIDDGHSVLYYILPAVCICGMMTTLCSACVLLNTQRVPYDLYLLMIQITHLLLLFCGLILHLDQYTNNRLLNNMYAYIYGPVSMVHSWLHYSSTWMLVVLTLERTSTLTNNRAQGVCSRHQAGAIVSLVLVLSFLSALPQFWQYEVTETMDYSMNQTVNLVELTEVATTPQYDVMYYWYTTAVVITSHPLLIIMVAVLSRRMKRNQVARCSHNHKHNNGSLLKRRYVEELNVTRLCIAISILFFIFTFPAAILHVTDKLLPFIESDFTALYDVLYTLCELVFYFYYATHFPLLCSYNDRFRYTLLSSYCFFCFRCCTRNRKQPR